MRHSLGGLASLILVLISSTLMASTEPTASWVYGYIDDLMLRAGGRGFFVNTGPYARYEIARYLKELNPIDLDEKSNWLYSNLSEEFKIEILEKMDNSIVTAYRFDIDLQSDSRVRTNSQIGFDAYMGRHVSAWGILRASINCNHCHKVYTKPWKDVARCGLDAGGLVVAGEGIELFFGRDEIGWGGDISKGLLISGQAPCFDMVKFRWQNSRFCYSWLGSKLRRWECDPWSPQTQRYLTAHRIEFVVWDWLNMGFSEAVVYGGENRGFELGYLNPVAILYAEQWNLDKDDNILGSFDFSVSIKHKINVKGEILIDDFQYDPDAEPNKVGGLLSISAKNPLLPALSTIHFNCVKIQPHVYTHRKEFNQLTHEGSMIGYPVGSDVGEVFFGLDLNYPANMLWRADFGYVEKGRSGLSGFSAECGGGYGLDGDQKILSSSLALRWHGKRGVLVEAQLKWSRVDYSNGSSGRSSDDFSLSIWTSVRGRKLLKLQ